jgi:hypothetical protein
MCCSLCLEQFSPRFKPDSSLPYSGFGSHITFPEGPCLADTYCPTQPSLSSLGFVALITFDKLHSPLFDYSLSVPRAGFISVLVTAILHCLLPQGLAQSKCVMNACQVKNKTEIMKSLDPAMHYMK